MYGSLSRLNFRNAEKHLPKLTQRVQESNLFSSDPGKIEFRAGSNPIRHVIYILKENRTYDQILGDLKVNGTKVGNGDPSLTMYGADVTPNEHKLALQFGVLDNFYDSGEVSGDGHDWSNAAITSDYNEKTWQIAYRGHERTYDYRGTVADEFPLEQGEPDVDAPGTGYIWDNLASHGLTYRDYGEFIAGIWCKAAKKPGASPKEGTPSAFSAECERHVVNKGEPLPPNVGEPHGSPSPWPWPVPLLKRMKATKAALRDHFNPLFPDFNTEYPDQLRADEFLNEFDEFVRARKEGKGTELPAFVLLYLARRSHSRHDRRANRAQRPRWPTTIWLSAAWSRRSRTVLTGMTRQSSSSKTTPRMAPTTSMRIARSRSRSASIRPDRRNSRSWTAASTRRST